MIDLMSFLHESYSKEVEKPTLNGFVDWAQDYLTNRNKVVNVAYGLTGLGLILQNGQMVVIQKQESMKSTMLPDTSIPVTHPTELSGFGMLRTPAVAVGQD